MELNNMEYKKMPWYCAQRIEPQKDAFFGDLESLLTEVVILISKYIEQSHFQSRSSHP